MRTGTQDYVLSEDKYEIIDEGEPREITSEEVLKKLKSPRHEVIDHEDFNKFDRGDYTLSDYFMIEKGQYPRDLRNNKDSLGVMAGCAGLVEGASYLMTQEAPTAAGALASFAAASYMFGLLSQDLELGEAAENSWENLLE